MLQRTKDSNCDKKVGNKKHAAWLNHPLSKIG